MNKHRYSRACLSLIIGVFLASTLKAAQGPAIITDLKIVDSGSVEGVAKDVSSALIPGVTVTLLNLQTGVADKRITNASGNYSFLNVPPGTYMISGDLSGFSPDIRSNVRVSTSTQLRLDLVLKVAGVGGGELAGTAKTESIRLAWTAAPGTGNTYLIERMGPGLTLYTQVAGPISENSYVVDTKSSDFDGGAAFTYRVRVVDSALNRGSSSNAVQVRRSGVQNFPIVGNNVLDLLAVLPGNRVALRPDDASNRSVTLEAARQDTLSLIFTGISNRTLTFSVADGSQIFSWGCLDCSFVVGPAGMGPATGGSRGAMFKLSADASTIQVTCRAVSCDVLTAQQIDTDNGSLRASGNVQQRRLAVDETMTISAKQRAYFTVNTR